ncbi:MAG: hypothetical protein SGI77_25385 [Pirellulaceae bacterium]|nr:hypothetical protein [Pirellulaceae bacterium]
MQNEIPSAATDASQNEAKISSDGKSASTDESIDLENEVLQAEYRKAYLEQLKRMSCPGCGEDPTIPY